MTGPARTAIAVEPVGHAALARGRGRGRRAATVVPPAEAGRAGVGPPRRRPRAWPPCSTSTRSSRGCSCRGRASSPTSTSIRRYADRTWTCGKGVYAEPVAEHALALALAGLRQLATYARATEWGDRRRAATCSAPRSWCSAAAASPSRSCACSARSAATSPSCAGTPTRCRRHPGRGHRRPRRRRCAGADLVVLALALTPETTGILDARRLALLAPHAWVVNVARGGHIVTDDLVAVLADGRIGGAALDVTDPEPLPDGHPLWTEPRCIITPHTANTVEMAEPLLASG